jgi:hypothetical protein
LISTIIHLVAVKDDHTNPEKQEKLSQGISDLKEMAECHGFALRGIEALRYLAHRWDVDVFSNHASSRDWRDLYRPTSILRDQFCPNISIFETLQSTDPVSSSMDHPLFLPFPMQGLLSVVLGTQLEKEGFMTDLRN